MKNKIEMKFLILYLTLMVVGLLCTLGRWYSYFNPEFIFIHSFINDHISNLSISMMLFLIIGTMWLLLDVKFKVIKVVGIIIISINIIYETLISFLNTPDFMDALFGICGVIIAYGYLYTLDKKGLIRK